LNRTSYYGFWILGGLIVSLMHLSWWPLVAVVLSCLVCELVLKNL
jgi:hypothetical protein